MRKIDDIKTKNRLTRPFTCAANVKIIIKNILLAIGWMKKVEKAVKKKSLRNIKIIYLRNTQRRRRRFDDNK